MEREREGEEGRGETGREKERTNNGERKEGEKVVKMRKKEQNIQWKREESRDRDE